MTRMKKWFHGSCTYNIHAPMNIGAAPNNGMHPTADTLLVIHFQSPEAAGDAGR
jgi:hypothetical protein